MNHKFKQIINYFFGKNKIVNKNPISFNITSYWEKRYLSGGNSGQGSYGKFAFYKASIINDFIIKYQIKTVIELGAGDGNQLSVFKVPYYIGIDISKVVIEKLQKNFQDDDSKIFILINKNTILKNFGLKADLGLSLDVIYHLVGNDIFENYMNNLFDSSRKWVIIYSSDFDDNNISDPHVNRRNFSNYIKQNFPNWKLIKLLENPLKPETYSDFYFFEKTYE